MNSGQRHRARHPVATRETVERVAKAIDDVMESWRDEHYPAPPAPETVTVDGVTYTNDCEGTWYDASGYTMASWVCKFLTRIASDACVLKDRDARIAELEVELHETRERQLPLVRLRDEAYRQRDEARAALTAAGFTIQEGA